MQVFLSGVFIALIIILTPNLLPSPDKCMGLPQYIFEEVVAEWRITFIQCIGSIVSFYCWINKKGSKILTYTYLFTFFREDELDPESNKV